MGHEITIKRQQSSDYEDFSTMTFELNQALDRLRSGHGLTEKYRNIILNTKGNITSILSVDTGREIAIFKRT